MVKSAAFGAARFDSPDEGGGKANPPGNANAKGADESSCAVPFSPLPNDAAASDERIRRAVEAVVAGESERFDEIVAVLGGRIHAVAWRLTQNTDDALDVGQEALLRIYKALPAWKGRCRFSTWAHRIVLNTAVDYLRRQAKHYRGRVEVPSPSEEKDTPCDPQAWGGIDGFTPAHAAQLSETRRRVLHALDRLSNRQRNCFLLRHFQELSVREVAEVLGTTEGTVKRHLFRACRRLREILGPG